MNGFTSFLSKLRSVKISFSFEQIMTQMMRRKLSHSSGIIATFQPDGASSIIFYGFWTANRIFVFMKEIDTFSSHI